MGTRQAKRVRRTMRRQQEEIALATLEATCRRPFRRRWPVALYILLGGRTLGGFWKHIFTE